MHAACTPPSTTLPDAPAPQAAWANGRYPSSRTLLPAVLTLPSPRRLTVQALLLCSLGLSGCELLGIESPTSLATRKEAEGKAIGGACRHAGRAIEDCYTLNRRADKGAVFSGWREMNDYMRDNKIDAVPPTIPTPAYLAAKAAEQAASANAGYDETADNPVDKAIAKPGAGGSKQPSKATSKP